MSVEKHSEYPMFDAMSTEELEEILRMDSYGAADDKYDTDAILYIMEVVAQRKRASATYQKARAKQALKEFKEVYMPVSEEVSLYQFDHEPNETLSEQSEEVSKQRKRTMRFILRKVGLVAAVIVVVFGIMITVQAAGLDVFGAIARWTSETFGLSVSDDARSTEWEQENQSNLKDAGFDESCLPDWIPETFELGEMQSFTCDLYSNFYFPMDDPDGRFIDITITEYADMNAIEDVIYEKDGNPVQEIAAGDRHIYIFDNLGSINVICYKDNMVCTVTGSEGISQDILLRVLDSIGVIQ